ncbi:MAG: hypothetical protein ANABAC_2762 [Anaerolineae bacterium]|nr:MAG: hypothetical protein ANABAC_2762 [Anaerolineae bacterium]
MGSPPIRECKGGSQGWVEMSGFSYASTSPPFSPKTASPHTLG